MRNKRQDLYKQHMESILEIQSPKDLGFILIQYCQAVIELFNVERCGVLIPDSSIFMDSLLVKASKENGTIEKKIFIPTPYLPWKWQKPAPSTKTESNIINIPNFSSAHPYRYTVENLFKCPILALAICPLVLNDEVIGYLILANEKKSRKFINEEIALLEKIAGQAIKIIRPALKMGVAENRDRIIETIMKYKEKVSFGRGKDPNIIVTFMRIVHLPITWLLLINQDPQRGTKFYHAEVNDTLQVEKVEIGTLDGNSFDYFINELFILDPDCMAIPIVTENSVVGKLAVRYLQTESTRAMQEFYFLLLMHIAPYLADLMYL
jgi:transcriptional regulator with GAF, ATPase, and Fis domain